MSATSTETKFLYKLIYVKHNGICFLYNMFYCGMWSKVENTLLRPACSAAVLYPRVWNYVFSLLLRRISINCKVVERETGATLSCLSMIQEPSLISSLKTRSNSGYQRRFHCTVQGNGWCLAPSRGLRLRLFTPCIQHRTHKRTAQIHTWYLAKTFTL